MPNQTTLPFEIPKMDWCFDLELFYQSAQNAVGEMMSSQLKYYKQFSYIVNGIITTILVFFGLSGSIMLLYQIRTSRAFSMRLAVHLGMICVWDALLLLSCFITYAIPVLIYYHTWYYGIMAYILFVLQPFASFCVLGNIWQVLAITFERFLAVTRPLEQRTRVAQFSVKWICLSIILFSALLNLLPVPFERTIVPCFSIHNYTLTYTWLLKQNEENAFIGALLHLIPDLIFRAPIPILVIAYLTGKTIRQCHQRIVGSVRISRLTKSSIPLRLSLLSVKFIICNTLYMFNSILIEILGIGQQIQSSDTQSEEDIVRQYMNSFYLTDASNMLLVVHSATNWLLFYDWKQIAKLSTRRTQRSSTFRSTQKIDLQMKDGVMSERMASYLLSSIGCAHTELGRNIAIEVLPVLREQSAGDDNDNFPLLSQLNTSVRYESLHQISESIGSFVMKLLQGFEDSNTTYAEIREMCRNVGHLYFKESAPISVEQWKLIRSCVLKSVTEFLSSNAECGELTVTELEAGITKTFNMVLAEAKSGALCAMVEYSQSFRPQRFDFTS